MKPNYSFRRGPGSLTTPAVDADLPARDQLALEVQVALGAVGGSVSYLLPPPTRTIDIKQPASMTQPRLANPTFLLLLKWTSRPLAMSSPIQKMREVTTAPWSCTIAQQEMPSFCSSFQVVVSRPTLACEPVKLVTHPLKPLLWSTTVTTTPTGVLVWAVDILGVVVKSHCCAGAMPIQAT